MGTAHHNISHEVEGQSHNVNRPATGISYFTPAQLPPAGTALILEDQKTVPKLFKPLKLRGITLQNRIMLSPLCQYSAEDGHYAIWHITHMGGIIQRGPDIACVEATSVTPQGRITPQDTGLWKDSQIENLAKVCTFAHSQGQHIMIQLSHAGRKASTVALWLSGGEVAGKDLGGWPDHVCGPSAIPWNDQHAQPKEMSLGDIADFKKAFNDSDKRAVKAGFDAIELHGAHGYLLHPFVKETRDTIPKDMPLFYRISATDWLEEALKDQISASWTNEDSIKLAQMLANAGVDYLHVSTGGNHPLQHPHTKPAYQADFAIEIKKSVGEKMAVGAVGIIDNAHLANDLLEKEGLDMVTVGKGFQKNPGLVFACADELKQQVQMPNQIRWGFKGRGSLTRKSIFETEFWE
ncbi:NADH-dependent flavin oxidoreductase [Elasticomyces elasticus]|nr:NADH-dependent flavin oxidoreductase [Elasticomyces elasticus]KAK3615369.1 NADH-dependent flavin oxidoreductase [Elasticomyces elasticus]KAK4896518.1 NADH-dependent flavin oxidoreductase [Elasticomyces elasticus]